MVEAVIDCTTGTVVVVGRAYSSRIVSKEGLRRHRRGRHFSGYGVAARVKLVANRGVARAEEG